MEKGIENAVKVLNQKMENALQSVIAFVKMEYA